MAKHLLILAAMLCAGVANADNSKANNPPVVDPDGFTEPLKQLTFNPGLDQREFERSTLNALNVYDPLESWNRRVYHFNYRFDQWVFLPLVDGYRYVTPNLVESGIHNFFSNLGEVPTLANSLLQLKGKRAMNSTARLLFNTILGVGGIWDPATKMGLPRLSEDFGQTLGRWGVPSGPYLVLPIFGPSTVRDAAGFSHRPGDPARSAGTADGSRAWPGWCAPRRRRPGPGAARA